MTNSKLTVLLVEDDPLIAELAQEALVADGFKVCGIATNLAQSVALARAHQPDLAVVDVRLADGDFGTEVAVALKQIGNIVILYATGSLEMITADDVVGDAYLRKPYTMKSLCKAVEAIVEYVRAGACSDFPDSLMLMHIKSERAI